MIGMKYELFKTKNNPSGIQLLIISYQFYYFRLPTYKLIKYTLYISTFILSCWNTHGKLLIQFLKWPKTMNLI